MIIFFYMVAFLYFLSEISQSAKKSKDHSFIFFKLLILGAHLFLLCMKDDGAKTSVEVAFLVLMKRCAIV